MQVQDYPGKLIKDIMFGYGCGRNGTKWGKGSISRLIKWEEAGV